MSNSLSTMKLRETIDQVPRFALAHLPTPLEPLQNLSKELGGPTIWIKRDDCTGWPLAETRRGTTSFYSERLWTKVLTTSSGEPAFKATIADKPSQRV